MREILEKGESEADILQWLPVTIKGPGNDIRPYWFLHFPDFPDVVDPIRSTYQVMNGAKFFNAVALDASKAVRHAVMASPQRFPTVFVVSEKVRRTLVEAGLSGLDFDEVPMTQSSV